MGFNMNTPDPDALAPGTYLAEIAKVEDKSSKKSGDAYWLVSFKHVDSSRFLASDIWMIEGKGVPMTKKRMKFLGFKLEDGEIEPHALIGKRVFLALYEDEWQGEKRLKVNTRADDSCFGMYPEDAPPPGAEDVNSVPWDEMSKSPSQSAPADDIDNPF